MPESHTQSDCFAFFGTTPRNPRWSWSGRSSDGKDVAVTLWQDRFEQAGRICKSWQDDQPGEWRSRPGFVELIDNLAHARDNTSGMVHVILAKAKDVTARPRSIDRCFPQPALKMKVVALDEDEGTFTLERIDPSA